MDAISNIGNMFKGIGGAVGDSGTPIWQTLLKLGSAGGGSIGNILASNKRNQVLNQSLNNQSSLMALANNPNALGANISKLERPLSAGLTSSVGNAVQGYLGERGLSEAPGIASETLAQGLAPYQQQEQQMAINAYLTSLGLPAQATPRFLPYPQGTDLSKLFQNLFTNKTNVPFGTPSESSPSGAGVMDMPSLAQLEAGRNSTSFINSPTVGAIPDNSQDFNWMDMLNNYNGLNVGTT